MCIYVIIHTILPSNPVILWIELGGRPKWLPLNFGYHDVMHTAPNTGPYLWSTSYVFTYSLVFFFFFCIGMLFYPTKSKPLQIMHISATMLPANGGLCAFQTFNMYRHTDEERSSLHLKNPQHHSPYKGFGSTFQAHCGAFSLKT